MQRIQKVLRQKNKKDVMTKESVTKVENMEYRGGTYTGEMSDGAPHGHGKQTYSDGTFYEGEWYTGSKEG